MAIPALKPVLPRRQLRSRRPPSGDSLMAVHPATRGPCWGWTHVGSGSWGSGSLRWRRGAEAQGVGGGASSVRRGTLLAAPPRSPPLSPTLCPLPSTLPSGLAPEQEPQPEQQRRRQRSFGACSSHSSLARGGAGGGRAGGRRGPAGNCAEPSRTVRTGALRWRRRLVPARTAGPRASQRRWRRRRAGRRGVRLANWCS